VVGGPEKASLWDGRLEKEEVTFPQRGLIHW
jgi:hypothetical protein